MSLSRLGKPDPDLEGVELLFHQKGGSVCFGTKMALSLNGVDPSCMNSITGSTCRAKCSNIFYDKRTIAFYRNNINENGLDLASLCFFFKLETPILKKSSQQEH